MTGTIILTAIIIAMYLLDTFVFVPKGTKLFSKKHFIDGDKTGYLTKALRLSYTDIKRGQVWRLFTEVFLHVGIAHIVFNSLALLIAGYAIEASVGWVNMLLCFFFSALFSGILIAFCVKWEDGEGASTGIYGMIAMYLLLAIKQQTLFVAGIHPVFAVMLGIYAVVGMCLNKINFLEHLTSFIGGLIYGGIVLYLL